VNGRKREPGLATPSSGFNYRNNVKDNNNGVFTTVVLCNKPVRPTVTPKIVTQLQQVEVKRLELAALRCRGNGRFCYARHEITVFELWRNPRVLGAVG
jgi:hypothetical protein